MYISLYVNFYERQKRHYLLNNTGESVTTDNIIDFVMAIFCIEFFNRL